MPQAKHSKIIVPILLFLVSVGLLIPFMRAQAEKTTQETYVQTLTQAYRTLYTDESFSEIKYRLTSEEVTGLNALIQDDRQTDTLNYVHTTLNNQWVNQQEAEGLVAKLTSDEGLSPDITEAEFSQTTDALTAPFNTDYQDNLLKEVAGAKEEWQTIQDIEQRVAALRKEDGSVLIDANSLFHTIQAELSNLSHPVTRERLGEQLTSIVTQWQEEDDARKQVAIEAEALRLATEEALHQAQVERDEAERLAEEQQQALDQAAEAIKKESQATARPSTPNDEEESDSKNEQPSGSIEPIDESDKKTILLLEAEQKTDQSNRVGAQKIGINGVYKPYIELGETTNTGKIQDKIDDGHIVASLSHFKGSDDKTTYFGGHNPGVFDYMYKAMRRGSSVTVTDKNGILTAYTMVDFAVTDTTGKSIMTYTGQRVIDMYLYGTNEESIIIQFCDSSSEDMLFWYGVL